MLFTRNDYYILHNRKLDVEALYSDDPKSKYYYIVCADKTLKHMILKRIILFLVNVDNYFYMVGMCFL
jgi:hypothetical protein